MKCIKIFSVHTVKVEYKDLHSILKVDEMKILQRFDVFYPKY